MIINIHIISEKIYPYNESLTHIGVEKYDLLYIAGFDYKGMSLILNDTKTSDYFDYIQKLNKIGSFNCDKAIKTNDIQYILVEDRMLKYVVLLING